MPYIWTIRLVHFPTLVTHLENKVFSIELSVMTNGSYEDIPEDEDSDLYRAFREEGIYTVCFQHFRKKNHMYSCGNFLVVVTVQISVNWMIPTYVLTACKDLYSKGQ